MTEPRGNLIAVDGISGAAVAAEARAALKAAGGPRGGISWWDASGLFDQLEVAGNEAGAPSARTLLLLYAADLAFRLRWEIEPTLAEGKTVVAAPYVHTAIAFGRAAGLGGRWLTNLFQFAARPAARRDVAVRPRSGRQPRGFVEFASGRLSGRVLGLTRHELIMRTREQLILAANRSKRRQN
jgi:hypothetical protein